jgi:hypothetical protein
MKIIRDIILEPDYHETSLQREYRSNFAFRCRFIGNYLRRQIKEIKFEPVGYNRIFISACQFSVKPNTVFENTLRISVPFDKSFYDNLEKDAVADYFVQLYKDGLIKASQTHEVPLQFLLNQLQNLKDNNYSNEWEFKSKIFKQIGIRATLFCKMTMDCFSLSLILCKKNEIIFSREILNTLPDEIIYHHQFKDIVLQNNEIKVLNESEKPIFILNLSFKE